MLKPYENVRNFFSMGVEETEQISSTLVVLSRKDIFLTYFSDFFLKNIMQSWLLRLRTFWIFNPRKYLKTGQKLHKKPTILKVLTILPPFWL